jgi:hypothetical protein
LGKAQREGNEMGLVPILIPADLIRVATYWLLRGSIPLRFTMILGKALRGGKAILSTAG